MTDVSGTSLTVVADQFTYGPTVSDIYPRQGPTGGGTSVTIHGTGFIAGASVTFGGVSATIVTYVSANELTATAPPNTGTVNVTVTAGANFARSGR